MMKNFTNLAEFAQNITIIIIFLGTALVALHGMFRRGYMRPIRRRAGDKYRWAGFAFFWRLVEEHRELLDDETAVEEKRTFVRKRSWKTITNLRIYGIFFSRPYVYEHGIYIGRHKFPVSGVSEEYPGHRRFNIRKSDRVSISSYRQEGIRVLEWLCSHSQRLENVKTVYDLMTLVMEAQEQTARRPRTKFHYPSPVYELLERKCRDFYTWYDMNKNTLLPSIQEALQELTSEPDARWTS